MWLDALGRFVLEAYIFVLLAGILVRLNSIPGEQLAKGAAHAGLQSMGDLRTMQIVSR
jgi:hypothetical protein